MKTRILLWGAVFIQLAGFVAGSSWRLHRPQVVVLDNDDTFAPLTVSISILKRHILEFTARPEKL